MARLESNIFATTPGISGPVPAAVPTARPERNILVTSALPYANGSIHIGHLVEYIQTDIWVRYQRLRGNTVTFVCGDDAHGTAIMVAARKRGISPEALIAEMNEQHKNDYAAFDIKFDNYDTTNSELNRTLSYAIYERLKAAGYIARNTIEQFYDPVEKTFLADRFIRGTCPFCNTPDQYGDGCESCGHTYTPTELINPRSDFSDATPILKETEHIYLRLEPAREFLLKLLETNFADESVANKLKEWFSRTEKHDGKAVRISTPLRDWDISRDAHFFGFEIPGETGKYFYNWFDAPVGYIASMGKFLHLNASATEKFWNDPDLEVIHFIGKDIQYFHGLFWPTMLHVAGLRIPSKIAVHGFLTVNGEKMSKSRGTFIKASTFAKHLDPQYLRYYFATKLGPTPEDIDLSFEDLAAKINGELVNKIANLASRGQILAKLDSKLGVSASDAIPLLREIRGAADIIAQAFDSRDFALATRTIAALADKANKYVEDQAPWKLIKTDPESARGVVTAALEAARILAIYLQPILPDFAAKIEKFLNIRPLQWRHIQEAMEPHTINPFEHLIPRLDVKAIPAMIEESKESQTPVAPAPSPPAPHGNAGLSPASATGPGLPSGASQRSGASQLSDASFEPLAPAINIDQFAQVDLRVARVTTAAPIEKSDKLMKLSLDLGPLGTRTVLAGIKKAYAPEALIGRLVIICANLAPRAMGKGGSFGTSEGMICAAGPGGAEIFILAPDTGAQPGQRVH